MIFKFTDGTEYTVLNDSDFKHMIGYYLENDLVFLKKEAITTDNSCIDSLYASNTTKEHIKKLFNNCIDKAIMTISIYDLKQYCMSNKLQYQSMYVKAYNKAADKMNNGGIDRFNNEQRKKHGEDFAKRDGFLEDYEKLFDDELQKIMNKSLIDFRSTNINYQKADALVKKYSMTKWDDLAKNNQEDIDYIRSKFEK